MSRSRWPVVALVALGACVVVLPLTVRSHRSLRTTVLDRAQRATEIRLGRARDALAFDNEALGLTAHNASSNPRLIAAVKGRVDGQTFADLFQTEPWWEPYRRDIVAAVSYDGVALAF